MTREEAIYWLENLSGSWDGQYREARDMAIAALREQEERSKGCEYCTEYKELPEHCLNDGQDVGRIFDTCIQETNQGWHIELPTNFDIGIRFCPMCGRRLEEV